MSELLRIASAVRESTRANEPTWLASVLRITGSAYRRPGARMLFGRDGVLAGSVSGGCIDRDVVRTGAWVCQRGPVVRSYDSHPDEAEPGARSGCGGKLELLIEPVSPGLAALLQLAGEQLERESRVALATVVSSRSDAPNVAERLLCAKTLQHGELSGADATKRARAALSAALTAPRPGTQTFDAGGFEALLEVIDPSPHCFIFGCGEDALPVAQLARLLDWRVTVCSTSRRFSVGDRFAGLAELTFEPLETCVSALDHCARPIAIVMNHDYERDRSSLAALLGSSARYIGMLGPTARTQRMLRELDVSTSEARALVHGPAGLHLGAEVSPEIALSIVAEAQAVLAGADGGFLRDRRLGIHESVKPTRLELSVR